MVVYAYGLHTLIRTLKRYGYVKYEQPFPTFDRRKGNLNVKTYGKCNPRVLTVKNISITLLFMTLPFQKCKQTKKLLHSPKGPY